MTITLRPDIQERLDARVQNGEYENADALVQQALDWFLDSTAGHLLRREIREWRGKVGEPCPSPAERAIDNDALAVASRIASMADREVRQRYHDLVDKRLESELTVLERFELERIEARLDAEDRDPQIEARDRQWETERTELLQSIEDLLQKLRK
jgi:Arc/MetJ-type ribon-helix-helix transcriptional regulator